MCSIRNTESQKLNSIFAALIIRRHTSSLYDEGVDGMRGVSAWVCLAVGHPPLGGEGLGISKYTLIHNL